MSKSYPPISRQMGNLPLLLNKGEADTRPASETIIWQKDFPGLGQRFRNGKATWIFQRRFKGRTLKHTLGPCTSLSIQMAQSMTAVINARLEDDTRATDIAACGGDMTLVRFYDIFRKECSNNWKPATFQNHCFYLRRHVLPVLGKHLLTDLASNEVRRWVDQLSLGSGSKNLALAALSALMRHAEIRGLRQPGSNPCKGLRSAKSSFRAVYLEGAQYQRLGAALTDLAKNHPLEASMLRFIALTGARRSEAEGLRWDMIDANRAALVDSKSGPRSLWMGTPVLDILANLPRFGTYVFSGTDHPVKQNRINYLWNRLRTDAGLQGVRLHDLRHSFASVAVTLRYDLRVIGGLLGHRDSGSTEGYLHLATSEIRNASERVGQHFKTILKKAAPHPKPRMRPKEAPDLITQYITSSYRLEKFCALKGLDPDRFHKELRQWRSQKRANS